MQGLAGFDTDFQGRKYRLNPGGGAVAGDFEPEVVFLGPVGGFEGAGLLAQFEMPVDTAGIGSESRFKRDGEVRGREASLNLLYHVSPSNKAFRLTNIFWWAICACRAV